MGDAQNNELRGGFDSRLKLTFCGSKVTSDAGLLAYRELDESLALTEMGEEALTDSRLGTNKQHLLLPRLWSLDTGRELARQTTPVCWVP